MAMATFKQFITESWRGTATAAIKRMSADQARSTINQINAETLSKGGATIISPTVRSLTGGFNSQSINFEVMRMLGKKAGIIKG